MQAFQHWLAGLYAELSYGHIVVLMSMQASLFPVPAELVVLPAGYLARNGQLDPALVLASGAIGIFIGASFNYLLARTLGRLLVLKYGRYLLITEPKYLRAERIFLRNAYFATSVGRMVPLFNRLIPLPAGVFRMPYLSFALMTAIGASMQCCFWVGLGYFFGEQAIPVLREHLPELALAFLASVPLAWFVARQLRRRRSPVAATGDD